MRKVILITGASSGIGYACAEALAKAGHTVYGTARKTARIASAPFHFIEMDVTNDVSVQAGIEYILKTNKRIDVLVNNAGNGIAGPSYAMPMEAAKKQFEVNFFGVVRMSCLVIPKMLEAGNGLIINISSLAGLFGLPYQGLYSASKFAIEGYSESLRMELRPSGIRVVVVNPGDFKTDFMKNREMVPLSMPHAVLNAHYRAALKSIEKDEHSAPDPDMIARQLCRIIDKENPAHRYLVGQPSQTIVPMLKKLLPGTLFEKLLGKHYGI